MRNIGAQAPPTRYEVLMNQQARRKAAIQKAQDQMGATRSVMVNHINSVGSGQVQISEMALRSRVSKKA